MSASAGPPKNAPASQGETEACPAPQVSPRSPTFGASGSQGCFACGIAAGIVVTAALNPWDRALFLSIVNHRPFFSRENWGDPYRGLAQTLLQRSISSGIYFPLEDIFSQALGSSLLGGQAAGVTMGLVLNPLAYVKYQCWGATDSGRLFLTTARRAYRDAGPLVFLRGAGSGAARDAMFGLCFSLRKVLSLHPRDGEHTRAANFAISCACAALGTAVSAPFNYVRSMAFAEKPIVPMESFRSKYVFTQKLWEEVMEQARDQGSVAERLRFMQGRFRLGWGTARVAVGMAVTDQIYIGCCSVMAP